MTKQATLSAIKSLGLTARCTDGEFRISWPVPVLQAKLGLSYADAMAKNEAIACYTDDADDALGTARQMAALGVVA